MGALDNLLEQNNLKTGSHLDSLLESEKLKMSLKPFPSGNALDTLVETIPSRIQRREEEIVRSERRTFFEDRLKQIEEERKRTTGVRGVLRNIGESSGIISSPDEPFAQLPFSQKAKLVGESVAGEFGLTGEKTPFPIRATGTILKDLLVKMPIRVSYSILNLGKKVSTGEKFEEPIPLPNFLDHIPEISDEKEIDDWLNAVDKNVENGMNPIAATAITGFEAALDLSIIGGIFEGMAKAGIRKQQIKLLTEHPELGKLDSARQVLGITERDSLESIHKKYLELARKNHPDIGGSQKIMADINAAYKTLTGIEPKIIRTKKILDTFSDDIMKIFRKEQPETPFLKEMVKQKKDVADELLLLPEEAESLLAPRGKLTKFDTPEIIAARAEQQKMIPTIQDTSPQRVKLREDLSVQIYGNGAANKNRRVDIVMGLPAAGKSSAIADPLVQQYGSFLLDSDIAKPLLGDIKFAGATHQESKFITESLILDKVLQGGDNVVFSTIGHNLEKTKEIIQQFQEAGYEVNLHFNDLPLEKSIDRAIKRFYEDGRFVDPAYIQNVVGLTPSKNFDILIKDKSLNIKSYGKYSNDVSKGQPAEFISGSEGYSRVSRVGRSDVHAGDIKKVQQTKAVEKLAEESVIPDVAGEQAVTNPTIKNILSLPKKQAKDFFIQQKIVDFNNPQEVFQKLASVQKGIDNNMLNNRIPILYGGYNQGVFTDGFLLIRGDEAKAAYESIWKKDNQASVRKMTKLDPSLNPDTVLKELQKNNLSKAKEFEKEFPDWKQIVPKEKGRPAQLVGNFTNEHGMINSILSDGKMQVAVDPDKLAFMVKQLPKAEIQITGEVSPVKFMEGDELKGLLMPIKLDSIPKPPKSNVEKLIERNAREAATYLREQQQAGFARVPFGKKEPPKAVPRDEAVKNVLERGRKKEISIRSLWEKPIKSLKSRFKEFQFEGDLIKTHPQLVDDIRTGLLPIPRRAIESAEVAVNSIFVDMTKAERETVLDVLFLRNFKSRAEAGMTLPGDLSLNQVTAELGRLEGTLTQKQVDRIGKMRELLDAVQKDLQERGVLGEDQSIADYTPHIVSDYLPDWWEKSSVYLPKRLRAPYRAYSKKAHGSTKDIITDERALQNHLGGIFLDNMVDDWAMKTLSQYDAFTSLKRKLPKEYLIKIFGDTGVPQPNRIYEIDGKQFRAFQYKPGRVIFPANAANPALLEKASAEGWTVEQFEAAGGFNKVGALGRYKKSYLVDIPVYNRFLQLKAPAGDIGFLYDLMKATTAWKRITLDLAGLPFQTGNAFGDFVNLYRTAPGAALKMPEAFNILKKSLSSKPVDLTPRETDLIKFLRDKDILTTGFVQTYIKNPRLTANPFSWIETASDAREKLMRISMGIYQYDRVVKGLPVKAPEINVKGLDPLSAAGKVAREFTVDYAAVSPAYRKAISRLIAPFAKFFTSNLSNWTKYAVAAPGGFSAKFIAPYVATWVWNNTEDRKEIEENMPSYFRERLHINIKKWDINGDGIADRALVWSMETPLDLAASWFAFTKFGDKITQVRAGRMTAREAAIQQLKDMGVAAPEEASQMLSPMIQFIQGVLQNKDPFTHRTVVPDRLKNTPEEKKLWAAYFFEKVALPVAQYSASFRKGESSTNPVIRWLEAGPLDVKRAMGFFEVDLSNGTYQQEIEIEEKFKGQRNQMLFEIEKAFIQAPDTLQDKINEAVQMGISGQEIGNRISSPRVVIEMLKEKLRSIDDKKEREQYEMTIMELRKLQRGDHIKSIPKSIRIPFLQELIQRNIIR